MERIKYLRGLTLHARTLSLDAFNADARWKCLKALVSIAIVGTQRGFVIGKFPRTWLSEVKHVGPKTLDLLESIYRGNVVSEKVVKQKYPSAAVASLIKLLDHEDGLSILDLLEGVNPLLEFPFNPILWDHDNVTCVSYDQVKILVSLNHIKESKRNKRPYLTLTNQGRELAQKLQDLYLPIEKDVVDLTDASELLVTVKSPVVLIVDDKEGGGRQQKLHDLLRHLDRYQDISIETRSLTVGDYSWIYRNPVTGVEETLPFLCERKQIVDLAVSLTDGRWERQQENMKRRAKGFANGECPMVYLLEMDTKDALAKWKCACGQQHISRCDPKEATVHTVKTAIEELRTQGFEIVETYSWGKTAEYLANVTRKFQSMYEQDVPNEVLKKVTMGEDRENSIASNNEHIKISSNNTNIEDQDSDEIILVLDEEESKAGRDEKLDQSRDVIVLDSDSDDDGVGDSKASPLSKKPRISSSENPGIQSTIAAYYNSYRTESPVKPASHVSVISTSFTPPVSTPVSSRVSATSFTSPVSMKPTSVSSYPSSSPNAPSLQELKNLLRDRGENFSGSREKLMERLLLPRKPQYLIERVRTEKWVPGDRCGAFAIFCVLDREQRRRKGGHTSHTVDEFVDLAEVSGILKEGKSFKRKQGKHYDAVTEFKQKAMSNNSHSLTNPPFLVKVDGNVPYRWVLTDPHGLQMAEAIHLHAHLRGYCQCSFPPPPEAQ